MEKYSVFVASPGDVKSERESLDKVIDEVNLTHGIPFDYELDLLTWEKNAFPAAGAPQTVINEIIDAYDIFIGIMWKRFGTPTPVAGSGTEEEYRIAYRSWEKNPEIGIMFYFSKQPFFPQTADEIDQLGKVFKFKQELNTKSLTWEYDNPTDFEAKIRKHLCLRMNAIIKKKKQNNVPITTANNDDIEILKNLWPKMDAELQRALSRAYNENRMAGDGGIKTKDLFATFMIQPGEELNKVFNQIPDAALPEPVQGALVEDQYIIEERPWLSHCISSSLRRLGKALPEGKQLTALDVFTDIAKNGSGESVALLRKHNIGPKEIEAIMKTQNLKPLTVV